MCEWSEGKCFSLLIQHFDVHVNDLTAMVEERLLFRVIQWVEEGLTNTGQTMDDSEGKEAFSMLTRR